MNFIGKKIVCVQFWPFHSQIEQNIEKIENLLLNRLEPNQVDLLIFPEMALTGYVFDSPQQIEELLPAIQKAIEWAQSKARALECFVQVGLPEKKQIGSESSKLYNSIYFISPLGNIITTYQKHFLYEDDETWAEEGPGFISIDVDGLGKVGFGICMDVNPYKFEAPFDAFEFAHFHKETNSKILLLSMAWLLEKRDIPKEEINKMDPKILYKDQIIEPSMTTVQYWAQRLYPLIARSEKEDYGLTVVICNRSGHENGSTFCGSSCVFTIKKGKILLHGVLGRGEESLLIC